MRIEQCDNIDSAFLQAQKTPSDINKHLAKLYELGCQCDTITEFGVRWGTSSIAFLAARPKKLIGYDVKFFPECDVINKVVPRGTSWERNTGDIKNLKDIEDTDLIMFDSEHSYEQLIFELQFAPKARKFLVFHDTVTCDKLDATKTKEGIGRAIREFKHKNPQWQVCYETKNNNGLMVMERCGSGMS